MQVNRGEFDEIKTTVDHHDEAISSLNLLVSTAAEVMRQGFTTMENGFSDINRSMVGIRQDLAGMRRELTGVRGDIATMRADIRDIKDGMSNNGRGQNSGNGGNPP